MIHLYYSVCKCFLHKTKKQNIYCKPELELYLSIVEEGFYASLPGEDSDFEYGDGGDAW